MYLPQPVITREGMPGGVHVGSGLRPLIWGVIAQALLWSLGDQVAEVMQVVFALLSMVVAYLVITVITRGISRLFPRLARWNS